MNTKGNQSYSHSLNFFVVLAPNNKTPWGNVGVCQNKLSKGKVLELWKFDMQSLFFDDEEIDSELIFSDVCYTPSKELLTAQHSPCNNGG